MIFLPSEMDSVGTEDGGPGSWLGTGVAGLGERVCLCARTGPAQSLGPAVTGLSRPSISQNMGKGFTCSGGDYLPPDTDNCAHPTTALAVHEYM